NSSRAPGSGLGALDPYSTTVDRRSRTWFVSFKHDHYMGNGALLEWGYAEDRVFRRGIPQGPASYRITPYGRSGNFFLDSTEDSMRRQLLVNFSPRPLHLGGTHQLKSGIDVDRVDYNVI